MAAVGAVRANNYQGFNPESLKRPRHFRSLSHNMGDASCERLVIATVGLPARGKSYIAKKLQIYLSWKGHSCRVFNVGARRREQGDSEQTFSADFFRSDNPRGQAIREAAAMGVLSEWWSGWEPVDKLQFLTRPIQRQNDDKHFKSV
eukprot:637769_1